MLGVNFGFGVKLDIRPWPLRHIFNSRACVAGEAYQIAFKIHITVRYSTHLSLCLYCT